MSAGMPELGSKISLISKADIRYEGRLFTVDPQECTIALANVRSFGTEDREAECLVAPQNQIYDYILFRGSDIKDIRVVNNIGPLPNDPAIVQLSVPPSLGSQPYQPAGFSHPVLGHMGHGMSPYQTYGGMGPMGGMPSGMAPGMGMYRDPRMMQKQPSELVNTVQMPDHQTNKDQDFIGGSRTATPTITAVTRKSPTMDQGVQVSSSPAKEEKKVQQQLPRQPQQVPVTRTQVQQHPPREHQRDQFREQHPQREQHQREQVPREQRESHARERDYVPRERDHAPREPREQHPREQHREQRDQQALHPSQAHQMAQRMALQQGQRGGWVNRGAIRRGRGRGGIQGMGFSRPLQATGPGNKPKNTLKFENDYDFEQANTEFEELRTQLTKLKVDGVEVTVVESTSEIVAAPVVTEVKVNGETDKKEDSGNETGVGDCELEEENEIFYDKAKSFFDNISCEAVERSKGRSQRTDWRTERKLNSETFGVASARRGGFRGRGYYNNRGMGGGMYRGGYRGGYRGQGPRGGQRGGTNGMPVAAVTQRPVAEVK